MIPAYLPKQFDRFLALIGNGHRNTGYRRRNSARRRWWRNAVYAAGRRQHVVVVVTAQIGEIQIAELQRSSTRRQQLLPVQIGFALLRLGRPYLRRCCFAGRTFQHITARLRFSQTCAPVTHKPTLSAERHQKWTPFRCRVTIRYTVWAALASTAFGHDIQIVFIIGDESTNHTQCTLNFYRTIFFPIFCSYFSLCKKHGLVIKY